MKRIFRYLLAAAAIAGIIGITTRAIYRANKNLVTLNIRRMDVRQVVRKIEWQTWETILVQTNVHGPVTLAVKNMPLEKVLELIAEQTSARSTAVYPLYSSSKSLASLKQILRSESNHHSTWTNLQSNGGPRGFGFGGPRPGEVPATNDLISLQITARDLPFTLLALNRFSHLRVIPEDGTAATISLSLNDATPRDAVAALARKTQRKWTELFTLRQEFGPGGRGPGGPPSFAGAENRRGPRPPNADNTSEQAQERQAERDVLNDQLLSTLPAEDREKIEAAQLERQKEFAEMQNLTPEQRREVMMQRGGPGGGGPNRMLERLKNSTPEQRAQRRPMAMRPGGPAPQFSRQ
jgi:hypothetical protein